MQSDKKTARRAEIEAAAHKLFAHQGFDSTSMLAVAKAAKASNETMYRWYGDKTGLFESMVQANAAQVKTVLEDALTGDGGARAALDGLAPVLLGMLLSDAAIVLNRAAAGDPTGALGRVLAQRGREDVFPLIRRVLEQGVAEGVLLPPQEGDLGALFLHLLVGDMQVRRVIGTLQEPNAAEVQLHAQTAVAQFLRLCGP